MSYVSKKNNKFLYYSKFSLNCNEFCKFKFRAAVIYMIKSISCKSAVQILVFSFLFLLYSCKHRELLIADQSQDLSFYPIENGNWAEFEVDSIVHFDSDDAGKVDTAINRYHFYIREEVDSFYMDGENQKTHLIKRYRRENDTFPWTFINLWTVNVNPYSVQRVEDNIRFIRLTRRQAGTLSSSCRPAIRSSTTGPRTSRPLAIAPPLADCER